MSTTTTTPRTASRVSARPPRPARSHRKRESRAGLAFVTPALFLLVVFFFIPVVLCFVLAFTDARLISPEPTRFIGLENFRHLIDDPLFWTSLRNTFYFAVVVVPLQSAFALALALLVNGQGRGTNFFRTMYFVPVVTSIVVVSILWRFMYAPDGLVNNLLQMVTFNVVQGSDWLNDTGTAMPAIIFMSIWQAVGFG
jgi:multiple sugar transport system permease protein